MMLRVTVKDWHRSYTRDYIKERLLEEGLAQNVETPSRPVIYGDYVEVVSPAGFLLKVQDLQKELSAVILVQVG